MKFGFYNDWEMGIVRGDQIADVSDVLGGIHAHSPQEMITAIIENWDEVGPAFAAAADKSKLVPLSSVQLLPPVPRPDKIICMAVNYLEGDNPPMPDIDAFLKDSDCVIGDGGTVLLDPECDAKIFHHEAELAVVIGKDADHVKEADANDYVFGYTGFIDVSARIYVRNAQSYFQAKSWATHGPMGPFLVTKDEIPDPHNLNVSLRMNDYDFPGYNTRDMAHKIPECIAFASRIMNLSAGDIISTGTNHQNLGPMQEGDHLVVGFEGIGDLNIHVHDPLGREWPRGRDEEMATRMRAGESR